TLTGGSGSGDLLTSAFANTTFNDGSGADMQLSGTGGHSTFNVGLSPKETIVSLGGYNTINVSGGTGNNVVIQGSATDTLNIAQDYSDANITVAKGKGVYTLHFADGETVKVTGIDQATFNGTVHPLGTSSHTLTAGPVDDTFVFVGDFGLNQVTN